MCGLTPNEILTFKIECMSDAEIMAMASNADAMLQFAGNMYSSAFNWEHTKELANWQNQTNIENWKMANEYNTPSAQMERLKSAGLNPNLMYGQGNTGNAGSIAGASATPQNQVKNPFEGVALMQNYLQAKQIGLQNKQLESENEIKELKAAEELVNYKQRVRSENIARLFAADKSQGVYSPIQPPRFGRSNEQMSLWSPSILRESAEYKLLESQYKRGKLTDAQINSLNQGAGRSAAQASYIGHQVENQAAIDSLFQELEKLGPLGELFKGFFLTISTFFGRGGVQSY